MSEILTAIAEHTWAITRASGLRVNCCIAGSRIAQQAGRYFGIPLRPQPVRILIANTAALPLIADRVPVGEWPEEAWSLGSDGIRRRLGHYAGHLILTTPRIDVTALVDVTLPQFARPTRAMEPPPLVAEARGGWLAGHADTPEVFELPGCVVVYERWDDHGLFRQSPDWSGWERRYRSEVAAVIRAVRDALPAQPAH